MTKINIFFKSGNKNQSRSLNLRSLSNKGWGREWRGEGGGRGEWVEKEGRGKEEERGGVTAGRKQKRAQRIPFSIFSPIFLASS